MCSIERMPIQISLQLDARTALMGAALNRRFDCPVTNRQSSGPAQSGIVTTSAVWRPFGVTIYRVRAR
jgi:hypothetical protein